MLLVWNDRRRAVAVYLRSAFSAITLIISILTGSPAMAAEYAITPGQKAVGELRPYVIQQGDVFPDIARRFDVGYTALVAANRHRSVGARCRSPNHDTIAVYPAGRAATGDCDKLGAMAALLLPAGWRSG